MLLLFDHFIDLVSAFKFYCLISDFTSRRKFVFPDRDRESSAEGRGERQGCGQRFARGRSCQPCERDHLGLG